MLKFLWRSTNPEEQAQAQQQAAFYALNAQKELVAEKRKNYDLIRLVAQQAEKNMQDSKTLCESAISSLGSDSKEAQSLDNICRFRQTEYKQKWQQLADARKDLDQSIIELNKKMAKTPEPAVNIEPIRQPGRVVLPPAVVQHFQGNNREHVSTEQTQATRQELTQTRSGINFSQMHQKLARTLHLSSSRTPVVESDSSSNSSTSSQKPEIPVSRPTLLPFKAALEEKFKAMNIQNQPQAVSVDEELKLAIRARRSLWE